MRYWPGDLIFYKVTPQSGWISRLIAIVQLIRKEGTTTTGYSHVSVIESEDFQLEAWWPWSRRSRINWSDSRIEVRRVINASHEQNQRALRWCQEHLGQWYDLGEMLFGLFQTRHSAICTRWIARAWQAQGIDIAAKAGKFLAPNELIPMTRRLSDGV